MSVVNLLVSLGRFLEFQLTGQADFRLRIPFESGRTVDTELEGKLQLDTVQQGLKREFSMSVRQPILLKVQAPPPLGWKGSYYHSEGNLGRYEPKDLGGVLNHIVTVRPGLPTTVFRAILAHELVHAWQREHRFLSGNPALREGMARWVEYHFLRSTHPEEARKLLRLRHFTFGKAVETIVDYEKSHGREQTMVWLKRQSVENSVPETTD